MRAAILVALMACASSASAQSLVDPMRPATISPEGDAPVARSAGPVLEQIVLGDGRNFAVISGRRVSVGDTVGDARVVAIGADQVTLRGGTIQVLRMFPRSDKKGAGNAPQSRKAEEGS